MKYLLRVSLLAFVLGSLSAVALADHPVKIEQQNKAYANGDFQEAYQHWLVEAEKGDAEAQEMVGAMHAAGKGVPKDYEQAVKWYRKAAEQGNISAQFTLGNMYFSGQGVPKNAEYAYAWWLISGTNGIDAAKRKRKEVQKDMTSSQIARAQALTIEIMLKIAE